jgi:tripartite-type tricarboxylate transporter receptor subunit TctC
MAPASMPPALVQRLNREINRILGTDTIKAAFARLGAEMAPMSVAEYDTLLRTDIERRREWIRLAGIQPQ